MDRHHLLGLLDNLQSKYDFMDSEYKEFAEAIGGKKKAIEVKVGDMVKIKYEKMETIVDTGDDEFFSNDPRNEQVLWHMENCG